MTKVIYPTTWMAGREGEVADVIHVIAEEMMEHRADLLRHASDIPEGECQIYQKQAFLLEEYATVLNALYFQLSPEQWDPQAGADLLELVQVHDIVLPDWMLPEGMKPGKGQTHELVNDNTEYAINRFDNEGGRMPTEGIDPV